MSYDRDKNYSLEDLEATGVFKMYAKDNGFTNEGWVMFKETNLTFRIKRDWSPGQRFHLCSEIQQNNKLNYLFRLNQIESGWIRLSYEEMINRFLPEDREDIEKVFQLIEEMGN